MGVDGELLTIYYSRSRGEPVRCFCCSNLEKQRMFLRQVEGSDRIWKRYAVLPAVNGQKYTIGEKFVGRETQGEFIFWTPPRQSSKKTGERNDKFDSMCAIIYEHDKYWVTPLMNNHIFINDTRIRMKTHLKFGDYLSFGQKKKPNTANEMEISDDGNSSDDDSDFDDDEEGTELQTIMNKLGYKRNEKADTPANVRFRFMERELQPEAFLESDARRLFNAKELEKASKRRKGVKQSEEIYDYAPALRNGLVLSHILSYLPVQDLKNVRLVSHLWDEESVKILKKRTSVNFQFDRHGYHETTESMRFFRYINELGNNAIPNWEIGLPDFGTTPDELIDLSPTAGKPGLKFLEDLEWFLEKSDSDHIVKQIRLEGSVTSTLEYGLRTQILTKLQSTIQVLELAGDWELNEVTRGIYDFPTGIKFQKLQEFNLSMTVDDDDDEEDSIADDTDLTSQMQWLNPFTKAIEGVRAMRLKCSTSLASIFLSKLGSFFNLQEVVLHHTTIQAVNHLLKIEQPLKKLHLNSLTDMNQENIVTFEKIILKHARTLEDLQFIISPCSSSTKAKPIIHLPTIPKLKRLNIGWGIVSSGPYWVDGPSCFTVTFGPAADGIIQYEKHYPSLQSLTLWPTGYMKYYEVESYSTCLSNIHQFWETYAEFYNIFFPLHHGSGQVCKTLQCLDIPYVSNYDGSTLLRRAAEISFMFPNVSNEWMKKAREDALRQAGRMQTRSMAIMAKKVNEIQKGGYHQDG